MTADIAALGRDVGEGPIALLTDWNVGPLHADGVAQLLAASGRRLERVVLPAGEERKRIGPVVDVVERLLDRGWQRSAPVVALGGGVLGDMAGLVAALTLRGVPFVQLPTTLLAMVDSSVGGKVGVDHRGGKNLIGAFHQPRAVVADLAFLRTLPERELRAGFGEVVKSALLGDPDLVDLLESRPEDAIGSDAQLLVEIVARCVAFKAEVVAEDALEAGRRKILNFGHTIGHALEAVTGFTTLRHGEAVAIGMVAAAHLSVDRLGAPAELPARIARLLESLGLPTIAPPVSFERLTDAMMGDKKRVGDEIAWVFLQDVGDPRIVPVSTRDLGDMLRLLADRGILSSLE
jgi:3-dehydroquinate synthase